MELVFRDMAIAAWERRGGHGLAALWLRVLGDVSCSLPYQYYLAQRGDRDMTTFQRVQTAALAVVSIATALALNFVAFAVIAIGFHLMTLLPVYTSFRTSPPTGLVFMLGSPAITGLVACRTKPFYRPYWTAPAGAMLLAAFVGAFENRAAWYGVLAFMSVVGAATLVGCYLSTRLRRRTAVVQTT